MRPTHLSRSLLAAAVLAALGTALLPSGSTSASPAAARGGAPPAPPELTVTPIAEGLNIPWDVTFTSNREMLFTERTFGRIHLRLPDGTTRVVAEDVPGLWAAGESGLMGILADSAFAENRRFYTCHAHQDATTSEVDVRVVAWRLDEALTRAHRVEPLVTGIDLQDENGVSPGRHGGCRLRFGPSGALFVSTGDAAIGTHPQDLGSLNGKVLRVDPRTGEGLASNPFAADGDPATDARIWTYGHRNVQGLALRGSRRMWSVEHGTDRDDEVNRLQPGGNYGWDPAPRGEPGENPIYVGNRPMTDFSLPGPQIGAAWSSGFPTGATSGATWLTGDRWGEWEGALVVAELQERTLIFMRFTRGGELIDATDVLVSDLRLRTAQMGPNNALYVTTASGSLNDQVLKVVPSTG